MSEDEGRGPHYHKCPKCGKRVRCNEKWCDRMFKYCDEHTVLRSTK